MALIPLFYDEEKFSFDSAVKLFPNVIDLYLRSTTFDVALRLSPVH